MKKNARKVSPEKWELSAHLSPQSPQTILAIQGRSLCYTFNILLQARQEWLASLKNDNQPRQYGPFATNSGRKISPIKDNLVSKIQVSDFTSANESCRKVTFSDVCVYLSMWTFSNLFPWYPHTVLALTLLPYRDPRPLPKKVGKRTVDLPLKGFLVSVALTVTLVKSALCLCHFFFTFSITGPSWKELIPKYLGKRLLKMRDLLKMILST